MTTHQPQSQKGRNSPVRHFTAAEDAVIKAHYATEGWQFVQKQIRPGWGFVAIYQRALALGVIERTKDSLEFTIKMGGPWPKLPRAAA